MISRSILQALGLAVVLGACGSNPGAEAIRPAAPLLVVVRADGAMMIEGAVVNAAAVKQQAGARRVQLTASPDLPYSQFSKALKDLQALDVPLALIGEDAEAK